MGFILVGLGTVAQAATLTVGSGQTYATIQAAINAAVGGDTIEIHAGTYVENVTVDRDLTFVGVGGPSQVIVAPVGNKRVFKITARNSTYRGIGVDARGAVGFEANNSNVRNLTFDDVDVWGGGGSGGGFGTQDGGAIKAYYGFVTVTNSTFTGNTGSSGGAIDAEEGIVAIGNTFVGNWADRDGGAIYAYANGNEVIDLQDNTFEGNAALGGGFYGAGGAVYTWHDNGTITTHRVRGNTFAGNLGRVGGGLYMATEATQGFSTQGMVRDNLFVENTADDGGGVYLEAVNYGYYGGAPDPFVVHVRENTFLGNDAADGSGVYVGQHLATKTNNDLFAFQKGGPAYRQGNTDFVHQYCLFFDNVGGDVGGRISAADFTSTSFGVDPLLVAYSDDGDFTNDDTSLQAGSPALDAGNPLWTDTDGSVSNIGWTP